MPVCGVSSRSILKGNILLSLVHPSEENEKYESHVKFIESLKK